jgi:hypothetical protein
MPDDSLERRRGSAEDTPYRIAVIARNAANPPTSPTPRPMTTKHQHLTQHQPAHIGASRTKDNTVPVIT